ncbi:hypothetical protein H5410_054890 [Solanum commersonii]|uniref:Uncharacterized protein n=1 Tax=Solanum commersonii TaxID=4109 RepID=A0A9J5WHP9_SOLCO|nr:hypothetical protein H5410_054890 [Solanum commersonii]
MSYDKFYRVMKDNLDKNWGEQFVKNYHHAVIHNMIGKVHEIIDDECNKDHKHLDLHIRMVLAIDRPFEDIIDENIDDRMICFEELEKENGVMYMMCSHVIYFELPSPPCSICFGSTMPSTLPLVTTQLIKNQFYSIASL